jgi:hypothetical protein
VWLCILADTTTTATRAAIVAFVAALKLPMRGPSYISIAMAFLVFAGILFNISALEPVPKTASTTRPIVTAAYESYVPTIKNPNATPPPSRRGRRPNDVSTTITTIPRKGKSTTTATTKRKRPVSFSNMTLKTKKPRNNFTEHRGLCYNQLYLPNSSTGMKWQKEITAAARKLSVNNSIVITGGNWAYRGTVLNWIAHASNIGLTEYIVLCYGADMLQLVGSWEKGGHGILVNCVKVMEFQFMKIVALYHLNFANFIVTWSDSDALWIRPFMNEWILPHQHEVDFIGQKGTHPKKISKLSGSTICTGLYTVFPSNRTRVLMSKLVIRLRTYTASSDQMLVNHELNEEGSFDFRTKVSHTTDKGVQQIKFPSYNNVSSDAPRLGFLPHGIFPRSEDMNAWVEGLKQNPVLWHSRSARTGGSKTDGMMNCSLFVLKKGWEEVANASEVPAIIDTAMLISRKYLNMTVRDIKITKPTRSNRAATRRVAPQQPHMEMA